jgi:hypothetical protein
MDTKSMLYGMFRAFDYSNSVAHFLSDLILNRIKITNENAEELAHRLNTYLKAFEKDYPLD